MSDEIPKPDWWDRFWAKVAPLGECKVWIAFRDWYGYGRFQLNGKSRNAHKLIYEFHRGPVPKGLCVCHHCDNPSCVEISHLFLGTHKENMRDAVLKGRTLKGEKHRDAKLTEEDVKEIRASPIKNAELARRFSVDPSIISRARSGDNWSHV